MRDRLLARLFLRRFLENDLIGADADRHEVLATTCGFIITGGLFVTLLLSMGYLSSPFPMPRLTAVHMLRVQFLYATWSMIVMALLAVSEWDALALDSRDTSILGPLPLARGVIVRAKVSALVMFAAGFDVALNLVPGIIHPAFAVSRLRPSTLTVATLIAAHLTSTMAAGAFGFVAVLGLRELLRAVLGTVSFLRISVLVQAGLVVALVTTLLLAPGFSFRVANQWLARGSVQAFVAPPFWFVGIALAVALAVGTVMLRLAGAGLSLDYSAAPNALFAIQTLFVAALIIGFRHSVRVPAELSARWLFHFVRPANERAYLGGSKRAALVKLIVPTLIGLLPLHVLVFGWRTAVLHFTYGLFLALVFIDALLLGFRRLPFTSSYVSAPNLKTIGSVYAIIFLAGVYALAWLERLALSTTRGTVILFGISAVVLAVVRAVDAWQRENRAAIELDELPEPATLRLGLTE